MGSELSTLNLGEIDQQAFVEALAAAAPGDKLKEMEKSGRVMEGDQEFWRWALNYLWESRDNPGLMAHFEQNPQAGFQKLAEISRQTDAGKDLGSVSDGTVKESIELYTSDLRSGRVGEVTYECEGEDRTSQYLEAETANNRTVYLYPPTCC